jgi:hypothetical protein
MFMAIISFIIFAAIAGGFGYFIWTKSDLRSDLGIEDHSDDHPSSGGGGRVGPGRRKAD